MNRYDKADIQQIRRLSEAFYASQDFAHDASHAEYVVRCARMIARTEESNAFLVEAGAWLHQFHDHLDKLNALLDESTLPRNTQRELFHIVSVCRPRKIQHAETIEAKIVYDADALAVIGSYGLVRELLCNAVVRGIPWEENVTKTQEVQKLFMDTLQTDTARELAKSSNEICGLFWEEYRRWDNFAA
uniref:HD domain-containing protein n=1 Tax=Candidatus Kentrum eta TaxID=2126337 RepID=A0A450ULL0_9GAMM|nr:MAG: hypothetical protein BECKH772A_GA0070896_100435 [Candidatus Kentron sp. H]VFJ93426.1 MAG: hypothetical protein BECKH772B_GA0070898_100444 [Candidatus Kentron sp. H]VFK00297.1 MAG: hypothetical protein BECKH772C_GA0070978_100433 [Candidatus Kentron sp. H]